ncbi:flagellar hook-length control protein FliK [Serratia fonticola]|uniref:flagellar hook-length control protein FliK n=1 Tax=Serratia fonticola TaxID=47917 RepID=UPI002178D037|nr:flagellar hook-length control protein FliK [Serratia fonticola]CAI0738466.1 Flagellar hook-length control protein [Serratia fonticola]
MNLNVLSGLPATADGTETGLTALSLDDAGLSASFAQLLGERFMPEGQLKGKPNVAQLLAEDPQISTLSRQQLNQLLTSLSDRGRLLAAPQELDAADDSQTRLTQRDDEQPLHPVDTLDAASLQALFAMLPAAVVQPLPGNGVATAAEPSGDEAPLTGTASLLATLSEKPALSTAGLPASKSQPNADDKSALAKTDASSVLSSQTDNNQDSGTTPLKLAAESAQSSATPQHAAPAPVSSPVIASQPVSATVSAPATPQLNAQLGSQEWQQALSQQVLMFHRNGQQSAELRLHPQELGALQITLKLDDNQAQLHIASAHGQVRAAVEAALPHLRHALAESGINLGQSSVGGESLPQPQQSQQQASHQGGQPSYREQHGSAETGVEALSAPAALQAMARSVDGVDIFA